MGGIRKNKQRKRYNFGKNRKRMGKFKLPAITCDVVHSVWNNKKSTVKNLKEMGLVFDLNKDLETTVEPAEKLSTDVPPPTEVIAKLEEEAKAPREKGFRITKNQVEFLTYMLNKYGEDYKAMTRDKRNILQMTWKQFRAKIKVFKKIPEQFEPFLKNREAVSSS